MANVALADYDPVRASGTDEQTNNELMLRDLRGDVEASQALMSRSRAGSCSGGGGGGGGGAGTEGAGRGQGRGCGIAKDEEPTLVTYFAPGTNHWFQHLLMPAHGGLELGRLRRP